jgi:hypothetical protein
MPGSPSPRSRGICAGLDKIVGAFRTRALGHIEFPYVYLNATYLNVRNATGQVVSMAVIVASGIAADGSREILGLDVGDSEDETFWRGFLTGLKQRGLGGVRLVISDQHAGLVKALHPAALVPGALKAALQQTWLPACSAWSSPNPTRARCTRSGMRSVTASPRHSRRSGH